MPVLALWKSRGSTSRSRSPGQGHQLIWTQAELAAHAPKMVRDSSGFHHVEIDGKRRL